MPYFNPLTKRKITFNGPKYHELIKAGYSKASLQNLPTGTVKKTPTKIKSRSKSVEKSRSKSVEKSRSKSVEKSRSKSVEKVGTKRKIPQTKTIEYKILDNGGYPFVAKVDIKKKTVSVYENSDTEKRGTKKTNPFVTIAYSRLWVAESVDEKGFALLLKVNSTSNLHIYTYVGEEVYQFTTHEPITTLHSMIGNSAVVYSVAESQNYFYDLVGEIPGKGNHNFIKYVTRYEAGVIDFVWTDDIWFDVYKAFKNQKKKLPKIERQMIHKRIM